MGRRSRKRASAPRERRPPASPPSSPAPARRRRGERPRAPWGSFPLVELSILAGLILVVVGFASDPGEPRTTLLFGGLALISVASLELAIREHFAGYRSHTALLAGAAALLVAVPLWFTPLPQEALLVVAFAVGFAAFRGLRSVFEKRAEGMSWRA